ncbi:MAG: hypothetical protein ACOYM9_05580 [Bradymonadia bacterium]
MRRWSRLSLSALVFLALACEDTSSTGPRGVKAGDAGVLDAVAPDGAPVEASLPPRSDATVTPQDATSALDDGGSGPTPDAGLEPPEPVAVGWVEVALEPRRPLYGIEEAVVVRAQAFDRAGRALDDADFTFETVPPGRAVVGAAGDLAFLGEGPGAVLACTVGAVCGRAAFWVDAGPPKLTVVSPARGAALGGDRTESIPVRGNASDSGGAVTVRVNGEEVAVGPTGDFSLDVPARFGVNRVEVTADDGVRRPPAREVRDVLWAPRWIRADAQGVRLGASASLRIAQALLDADRAPVAPEPPEVVLDDLASLLVSALALADASALLAVPEIAEGEVLRLRVTDFTLGLPEVALRVVPSGLELFLRLPEVRISTEGAFSFQGESISLDGALDASIAAFALVDLSVDAEGALVVATRDAGVVVERLVGRLADPSANALLESLGSRLREVVETLAGEVVVSVVRDELPGFLSDGLGGLVGSLRALPINLDTGLPGAPVVSLTLSLVPSGVDAARDRRLDLELDGAIDQGRAVAAPAEGVPGVPAFPATPPPPYSERPLALLLRLELLNGLLHEVWRTGLLQLEPPLPPELGMGLGAIRLDARLPPVVAPGEPGSAWPLEVQIGELRVEIRAVGAARADVYALRLRAGLSLAPNAGGALGLVTEDEPRVDAELLEQADDRPVLSADALALLFGAAVWPELERALAGGLSLAIPSVEVDASAFAAFAPRLSSLTLRPSFGDPPTFFDGWLVLGGALETRIGISAP